MQHITHERVPVLFVDDDDVHSARPHVVEGPQPGAGQRVVVLARGGVHGHEHGRLVAEES